jgi:hypothetical protein
MVGTPPVIAAEVFSGFDWQCLLALMSLRKKAVDMMKLTTKWRGIRNDLFYIFLLTVEKN